MLVAVTKANNTTKHVAGAELAAALMYNIVHKLTTYTLAYQKVIYQPDQAADNRLSPP